MNDLLQKKIDSLLQDSPKHWYITQQNFDFPTQCRCTEALMEFKDDNKGVNLENYFKEYKKNLPAHRCLNNARYYGIITSNGNYDKETATPVYDEIKARCNGNFEDTKNYQDIIDRQIEKYYFSSELDENFEFNKEFSLFPFALLIKVLLEIGLRTGRYEISYNEYQYFVTTTRNYLQSSETVQFILFARETENIDEIYKNIGQKKKEKSTNWNFDDRTFNLVDRISYLQHEINKEENLNIIRIKHGFVSDCYDKIKYFETNILNSIKQDNYLDFLHSNKSIFSDENDTNKEVKKMKTEVKGLDKAPNEHIPQQIIFYGVPGSGKSFSISGTLKNANKVILEENTKRVVFHPEYSNSDFIGQILPKMTTSGINYVFTPGPFTQILRKAYQHPENNYALIIEEINRGNAAAIFGELFQLLDRLEEDEKQPLNNVIYTKNWSAYGVDNDCINAYLLGNFDDENTTDTTDVCINFNRNSAIRLPANLSLFATMNTSDQNVFTLDNAFQRRWDTKLIPNELPLADKTSKEYIQAISVITHTPYEWKAFVDTINEIILEDAIEQDLTSMEDKQIGMWFIKNTNKQISRKVFANKVLKYLWDDAFKFNREKIFNISDERFNTLSKIIDYVENETGEIEDIFIAGLSQKIILANTFTDTFSNEKGRKGKRISFSEINIQPGSELVMNFDDKTFKCTTVDDTKVAYEGLTYPSLSKLTRELMNKDDDNSPGYVSKRWYYLDKSLETLQKELDK